MRNNTLTQLIFQTVYIVLAAMGLLNSLGYFAADFNEEFYVYYTNLSNYICMGVMFFTLRDTYKRARRAEQGPCKTAPTMTFLCVILILVTFLVYNFLLAGENTVVQYLTSQSNMLMHVILPLMFVMHWVLFCEHPSLRWYHPLLSIAVPLLYVGFIILRAQLLPTTAMTVRYPYFFLDIDALGVGGFLTWILVLMAIFIAIGYLLLALDRAVLKEKKGRIAHETV